MIGFLVVAGLLIIGALLFLVPPLLGKRIRQGNISHGETNLTIYRDQIRELDADLANGTLDQPQYEAAKREIERRVLDDVEQDAEQVARAGSPKWTLAIMVAVLVPVIAVPTYLALGTPEALDPARAAAPTQAGAHDVSPEQIARMVDQVKARLRGNPDDVEGWYMLAKSTQAIGRYDESVNAYREIVKRVPPDAQLLADFADTLAVANGRSLDGEPVRLIEQALSVDPNNVKALALGGTAAFQKQDYAKAAAMWKKLVATLPPDAEFAQRIQNSIAEAEAKAGTKGSVVATASPPPAAGGAKISGKVAVGAEVAKSVGRQDTVFVFARASSGPRMPLAIQKVTVAELPYKFELTEAMAMAPGMSIAKFPDLVVGARISKSGNAMAQPGDWESELVPVKAGAAGVNLVISRQVK